jgi:Domain of Unknown Function (DUF1543)
MEDYKLFMMLLGCKPAGRNIEQHDIFFGIAKQLKDLVPQIKAFWPGSGKIHLDGFKTVTNVDGYKISVSEKNSTEQNDKQLFFINLGGYKQGEFEEFHYKILAVATKREDAIHTAKQTTFFKHTGFGKVATSHIDDKYGIDVDDMYNIEEILSEEFKSKFSINISSNKIENLPEDELHLGYFKLDSL